MRSGTPEETASRVREILANFDINPQHLLDLLRTTRGIVSGSAALLMVTDMDFKPGDLDIYIPASQDQTALLLVQRRLGYQLKKSSARSYENNADIKRVHLLTKGRNKIHVVTTKGENAAATIFRFHSTIVMNLLTAWGIYCAYPSLTLKRKGVANLPTLLNDLSLSIRSRTCYEKYRSRGVTLENDVRKFPEHAAHICHASAECPHTVRSTSDGKGLYVELFNQPPHEVQRQEMGEYTTVWMLGGPMCSSGNTFCTGFNKSLASIMKTVRVPATRSN
ncbi:hypothetical protein B0H16DRAFT_1820572 [Mycena metata]|uniref:Uncharacterized protein n=1 Tax=Mycena metata TaxID=1033252 RepID=A0AAD7NFB5_9AGAR|nr:hypothetical protein B0H16DRAFT_1820572 [Mycena metata]